MMSSMRRNDKGWRGSAPARRQGFRLRAAPDQFSELDDFRGRPLVLAFYSAEWSRPIRTVEELSDPLAVGTPFALDVARNNGRFLIVVR